MVLKRVSGAAGSGAGGFLGGFFNNPGVVIIAALAVVFVFFSGDIRKAFGSLGESIGSIGDVQLPDITLPTFNFPEITFPTFEFPEITLPELPDFSFLEGIFGAAPQPVPTPPPAGVIETEELGPVTTPEGCTVDENGIIRCPTPPTFDASQFVTPEELAERLVEPEPFTPPIQETIAPTLELPEGFVGEGISFQGGTIFQRDPCFMSLSEIIDAGLARSASAAADLKARACSENVTEEPVDFPTTFDFGTSTGSGLLPGEEQIVTGGATLESEEQRAACVTCELFGLNCPICRGEI